MRRILRTVPTYFPYITGPANQVRAISRRLRPLGYEAQIVTTTAHAAGAPRHEVIEGSTVVRLPVHGGVLQYQVALGAWRAISSYPAEIVHVHSYRNFLADVAAVRAALGRIPLVLHLHGSLASFQTIVSAGRRWPYRAYDLVTKPLPTLRAEAFVVSTRAEAEEARQYGLDPARVHTIPMGIDCGPDEQGGGPRDPRHILLVGRLCEDRNVELLLHALARLRDEAWRCSIVGGEERRSYTEGAGYLERLQRLAAELGLAGRLRFVGPLAGEALREAYASAGVFVYTSRWENFGQTLLEAGAAGCALVSTPVGVAPDLIEDGLSGYCLSAAEPGLLAERLGRLLGDPGLQRAMGERVRATVRRQFAWQPIMRAYCELYESLLGAAASRGDETGARVLPRRRSW